MYNLRKATKLEHCFLFIVYIQIFLVQLPYTIISKIQVYVALAIEFLEVLSGGPVHCLCCSQSHVVNECNHE